MKRLLKRFLNFEEMKRHKVKTAVYIVIRVTTVAVMIYSIVRSQWENTMTCAMTLFLLLIPSFVEHRLQIGMPSVMEVIVISFVFAANIMGEISSFYEKFPLLDTILHTLNGFICAGVGFGLIDILNRNKRVKVNLSPIFVCLFSFCFSMTAGTVWEFFEFAMDTLFAKDMQKDTIVTAVHSYLLSPAGDMTSLSDITQTVVNGQVLPINGYLDIGLIDTMKDLIVNFIGAVVFNTAGYFYLKGRKKHIEFIENFIPSRIGEESQTDGSL